MYIYVASIAVCMHISHIIGWLGSKGGFDRIPRTAPGYGPVLVFTMGAILVTIFVLSCLSAYDARPSTALHHPCVNACHNAMQC